MSNIRKIVSFEKLDSELKEALMDKYPDGWRNYIQKIPKGNGSFFYAVALDYDEYSYLIKVDVKIDSLSDLEKEEEKEDYDEISDEEMEVEFDEDENYDD